MFFVLKPYNRKRGYHHPLLAIDCENNPKTGEFICAGIYGDIRHKTTKRVKGIPKTVWTTKRIECYIDSHREFLHFLKFLKPNSCILIFFNLSYDKVYFDKIVNHFSVLNAGTRLIMLKLKGNKLKAIDLMNHVIKGSLEDWINYLDMEKKGIKKAKLSNHYDRVMNDVRATYELGTFIEDFYYNECKIPLQVTVGSSALKLFTMHYFNDYWKREGEKWGNYERRAYYGGRVEVFKRGEIESWGYDVSSMYLSIMQSEKLPDPTSVSYKKRPPKNWKKYLDSYLGIWHVKVSCPDLHIPLLPHHVDGKLKFPVGIFEGYWTSIELKKALSIGYRILKVYSFIYYKKSKHYLKRYADFIWGKRQKYKSLKNKGMEIMVKFLGNSLYGKFAQRNDNGYFGRLLDYPKLDLPDDLYIFKYQGEIYIRVCGEQKPAKHQFTAISVFIASYARLRLYEALEANKNEAVYCDTDSIFLTSPIKGVLKGKGLGRWTLKTHRLIPFFRPKMYGECRKGVPKRAKLKEKTEEYEDWIFDKPLREREAIRRGLTPNKWVTVTKHLGSRDDKRLWKGDESSPLKLI